MSRTIRALVTLYGLALRAFPGEFRRAHGRAMRDTFLDVVLDARTRKGRWGMLYAGLAESANALVRGLRERTARSRPEGLALDLRFALRGVARRPGFSAAVLLTLGLGIGANTAIFTAVDAVLLRPLPFPEPDRLVRVWPALEASAETRPFSVPDFEDWERASSVTTDMGLSTTLPSDLVLQGEGPAEELETAYVSSGFFETLGVRPVLGRLPGRADGNGDPFVVVLSHGAWERRFGGDPGVIGTEIVLDDRAYRVTGVLPPDLPYPVPGVEVYTLLATIPESAIPLHLRVVRFLDAVARLAPGVEPEEAAERLGAVARALGEAHPETNAALDGAVVEPLLETMVGEVRAPLLALSGAVLLVLLLACANVANLLLARGRDRAHEMAVRSALGAGRGRMARQMLVESVVLALLGGVVALALAWAGVAAVGEVVAGRLPRPLEATPDARVLAFTFAVAVGTGLAFGVAPAWRSARTGAAATLRSVRGGRRQGSTLLVVQAALAVLLLTGAGLMLRSLSRMAAVDPGFEPAGLLFVHMTAPSSRYDRAGYLAYQEALLEEMARIPGLQAVASIRHAPFRGAGERMGYRLPDEPSREGEPDPLARVVQVTPGALEVLGARMLGGRSILPEDGGEGPLRVVVNASMAREAFGSVQAALTPGARLRVADQEAEVVGVVEDVRHLSLAGPAPPMIYLHQHRNPRREFTLLLRTQGDPLALAGPAREIVEGLDPSQAVTELAPAEHAVRDALGRPLLLTGLLGCFAGLALALAAVGVYAVVAQHTTRRRREIGIRMALGAGRRETVGLVVAEGMRPVLLGAALGLAGSLVLGRMIEPWLFQAEAVDGWAQVAASALLVLTALVSMWLPARRAARVDPVATLSEV